MEMPDLAVEQPFCDTCPAVIELGNLFCPICRQANLLQLATAGSELIESPAATFSGDLETVSSSRRRLPSFSAAADVRYCRVGYSKSPDFCI